MAIRIVDLTDADAFALVPPCADPGFDHRSCDYWEDADRGSKAARASWFAEAPASAASSIAGPPRDANPFVPPPKASANPFTPGGGLDDNPFAPSRPAASAPNPFARDDDPVADNPFAPTRASPARPGAEAPRKLQLVGRGLGVFGSYAKILLVDEEPAAYAQFGPLSAYPRARRTRELYPQLPDAPLPAVITCIATTRAARRQGHALRLADAVCDDLASRGFSAIETYPEKGARLDATSAATVEFWQQVGFAVAVDDERFPVLRREL
jgi:ribosomal protein S18 acetylase RimI-like enzyme